MGMLAGAAQNEKPRSVAGLRALGRSSTMKCIRSVFTRLAENALGFETPREVPEQCVPIFVDLSPGDAHLGG